MGCFSWLYANSGKPLNEGMSAYVYCPDETIIKEESYDNYGDFGGQDIYDLVADWNRAFLSRHPEYPVIQHGLFKQADGSYTKKPAKRIDSYFWYKDYANLALTREEVVRNAQKVNDTFEYRRIGIEIACYDDQNAWLPYPIKIASRPDCFEYDSLPASQGDPNQGWGKYRKAENDKDNYTPNLLPWRGTHVCPVCGNRTFHATAHVVQEWLVDDDGEYIETTEECSEVDHAPDDEDIWQCSCCGLDEPGQFFTKPASNRRFVMKIYDRNLPYSHDMVGIEANDGKVIRFMRTDSLEELAKIWSLKNFDERYPSHPYAIIDTEVNRTLMRGTLPETQRMEEPFYKGLIKLSNLPQDMLWEKEPVYYAAANGVRKKGPFSSRHEASLALSQIRQTWAEENSLKDGTGLPEFSVVSVELYIAELVVNG